MEKRPIKKQRGHVPDKVWLYHLIPHLHMFLTIENPDLREPSDLGNLETGIKVRLLTAKFCVRVFPQRGFFISENQVSLKVNLRNFGRPLSHYVVSYGDTSVTGRRFISCSMCNGGISGHFRVTWTHPPPPLITGFSFWFEVRCNVSINLPIYVPAHAVDVFFQLIYALRRHSIAQWLSTCLPYRRLCVQHS